LRTDPSRNPPADPAQLETWDRTDVWHPFTPHSVYDQEHPLMVVSGEGNYLIDSNGNRYLDGVSSLWCNVFGHRHPKIDNAIRNQLDKIAHATFLGNAQSTAVELAHRLVELAPKELTRVFFSDNGSTSVEVAIKMAYQFFQQNGQPQRNRLLALENAYHGDTLGSVSVGGIDLFHEKFRPLLFPVLRAASPYCYRCPVGKEAENCQQECLDRTLALLEEHAAEIAAVVLEPGLQGAGGMIAFPEGYTRAVSEKAREIGAFVIYDEVAVGMGRSASMFACQREGFVPDFLCLAKGLTGGYLPLAATLTTEHVFEGFLGHPEDARTFYHGHTYTGNALGAAAALATLDIFAEEDVVDGLSWKEELLRQQLERLRGRRGVGDIRQYGLAAGIELVADPQTRQPFPASERRGMKVCEAARAMGVFLRPLGDVIVLMPPLSIQEEEIKHLIDAVEYGLERALP
jgi:adenosylmethionine-8-amino-7-oxononanoate aminotransferase